MIFAMLGEAWRAMGANRLRTLLTMLGMVIGVGAVVLMMSIGQGAQYAIKQTIMAMGSNLFILRSGHTMSGGVRSGSGSAHTLTVSDADAAHQQRNRGDRAQQQRHHARALLGRIGHGGEVAQEKIVFHTLADAMPLAQQFGHGFFHRRHDFLGGGLHHDHAHRPRKLGAEHLALRGGERNDEGVVLIAPVHALPFACQQAEDDKRALLDTDGLADRIFIAE